MPYPNEIAARMISPDECQQDSFRRENDKGGAGVDFIYAKRMNMDAMEIQAIRFDASKFTVESAGMEICD